MDYTFRGSTLNTTISHTTEGTFLLMVVEFGKLAPESQQRFIVYHHAYSMNILHLL